MKNVITSLLLLSLAFSVFNLPAQAQQSTAPEQDDVVRITSNLVQIDAIITDKDGNPVKDLTRADFELYQDGKLQQITNFSFVDAAIRKTRTESAAKSKKDKNSQVSVAPPAARINAENYGRVLTFVVDDGNCAASSLGIRAARQGLEKFVLEQMLPTDAVAIYQTRRGSSLIQQYTSDKTRLLTIIRKIRYYPPSSGCFYAGGSAMDNARIENVTPTASGGVRYESESNRQQRGAIDDFTANNELAPSISVMRYAVRGLQRIAGRKTMFLLSDGFPIFVPSRIQSNQNMEAVREMTDLANRASVVINTIDIKGLQNSYEISAADEVFVGGTIDSAKPSGTEAIMRGRAAASLALQDGLNVTAEETGGKAYRNTNSASYPIEQALNAEKGYYLLAYQPEDETFKGRKFHKIEIKLKRPGLKVAARSGFYGVTDESLLNQPKRQRSADSELYEALVQPFPAAGMNLQLSSFFVNSPTEGSFIRSLVHVNGADITFTDDANKTKKAVFDVVAVTMNEKSEVVDEFNRTHTVRVPAERVADIEKNGLVYTADVPVKKTGVYTFRLAVRDNAAKRLGATNQVIEVPDLKRGNLMLSGLILSGVDREGKFEIPRGAGADNAFAPVVSTFVPAVRRFRPGMILGYAYSLYNAQNDKASGQPRLSVQVNYYYNGELLSEGKPEEIKPAKQPDAGNRLDNIGYIRLNQNAQPGDYALQIIVRDLVSNRTASNWIDFEIAN